MSMKLYTRSKSGSQECNILSPSMPTEKWVKLKNTVCRLLRAQQKEFAASILEENEFNMSEGTNGFGDDFSVLHLSASTDKYIEMNELKNNLKATIALQEIISAFDELNICIRFIVVNVLEDSVELVPQPEPTITTEVVERALNDSQQLLYVSGAASAVDRVHTAIHGYLKAICIKYDIIISSEASLIELFKAIRTNHPSFTNMSNGSSETKKICNSLSAIIDSSTL